MKPISYIFNSRIRIVCLRTIAIVITVMLIFTGTLFLQSVTKLKTIGGIRDLEQKTFFDDPRQYDVLFFGTSHMIYGISPLEIWAGSKITSYNWGSPTCTIPSCYWKLINILDYQTPKLVVVDCFRATWEHKTNSESRIHQALDCFPLSYHKYQAVKDLMDGQTRETDGLEYTWEEQFNVLVPLSEYHDRWDSLSKVDFENNYVDAKGAEFYIGVAEPLDISNTTRKTEITEKMQGVIYLRKLIEECKSRNIPILLTYLPYPTEEPWKMEANMINDIADEYNVNYLDYTSLDVVNYYTDFYDSYSHMNASGQEKVSRHIGQYIRDVYGIGENYSDELCDIWDAKYKNYRDYKDSCLSNQVELSKYLMLLHDTANTIVIEIKDPSVLQNALYLSLIKGINDKIVVDRHTKYIVVKDRNTIILDDYIDKGSEIPTEMGTFVLNRRDDGYSLLLDNKEIYEGNDDDYSLSIRMLKGSEEFDKVKYSYLGSVGNKPINDGLTRE